MTVCGVIKQNQSEVGQIQRAKMRKKIYKV